MENLKSKVHFSKEVIAQISSETLNDIIAQGSFTLIDVRSPQGIENQGGIPGAVNIPLEQVKKEIEEREYHPESILNSDGPFLFCCTGGVMSYMAAIHAQEHGMKNVHNLEGGHSAWKKLNNQN
ncbi:Rhodanese-related sulfurtransferase [Zhouia amylolytica]|uniref:Rhodanese-related sulfurtransferase n=1 Tax=Zhouia amylolytica TaxID=376730 RepID=A0A1I6TSG3_9FLAO|nr:rhodanese-like domain-containing protein [Zhouia amylolytica]MCQ0110208.1 rhodanese-like domain-containing protein [Zhouia amylolytica]SFS92213.1 Rhodanese-related sulfurtransferase [Zhouia amylolytica]